MEPIKPTAALKSKIRVQHELADVEDVASETIADLPLDILEKIFGYIIPLESVRLAAVCKSWAAAVSERLARPTPHLFALEVSTDDRHWFQLRPPNKEHHRWAIFSLPVEEEDWPSPVATASLPSVVRHPKGMKLSGALPCGRLSFAADNRVVLVNPITGDASQSKMYAPFGAGDKVRTVAGANAIFDHDYSERSVSLIFSCAEGWSKRKLLSEEFKTIYQMVYTDGVLYALEFRGCTYTADTRAPPPWRLKKLRAPSILEQYTPISGNRILRYTHLLESDGSVLFVGPNTIRGFEVFRLDVEGARWVKVERLPADRTLFVSEQSSFTVRASEVRGCMSNCIYFVSDAGYYSSCATWGVYSMEERKVLFKHPVGGSPGKYDAARWYLPAVVIPLATLGKKGKNLSSSGTSG
ncbi:hypothetical protein ZWY2020_015740 [Hordeum vulgare]|nr:hypothetical protein ZWY2020_015740 [Hordeum vulgare]